MQLCALLILSVNLVPLFNSANGDNILLVPFSDGSHVLLMDGLGVALLDRGHRTFVLMQNGFPLPKSCDPRHEVVFYGKTKSENELAALTEHNQPGGSKPEVMKRVTDAICIDMVTDVTLWSRLEKLDLDLVIVDYFHTACYYLVPYKLGLHFVTLSSVVPTWHSRLPALPSVTEYLVEYPGSICAGQLDTVPLIGKSVCKILQHYFNDILFNRYNTEMHAYIDYPPLHSMKSNASLMLLNVSPLLGSSYPKTPNVEFVGGITTKPANQLTGNLQKWMDEADNVVIVSFGSRFTRLPNGGNEKLLEAFDKIPNHRFLVRFKESEYRNVQVPRNVKIVDWLPQNDILGHKHTRMLIYHCGLNGLFEALYHAVPVICLAVDADQPANSKKIEKLGYGFGTRASEFSTEWITDKVMQISSNDSYRQKIEKASRIFHSEEHPANRAVDAIEHIIRFGSDHLRPVEAFELEWWQFYMLDVLAAVYTIVLLLIFIVYKLTRALLGACCRFLR